LVRYSGTENKLRIMVEHKDECIAVDAANKIFEVAAKGLK
jgi:phosphomannomutase